MSIGVCPPKDRILRTAKAMYPDASAKEIAKLVREIAAGWQLDANLAEAQSQPHSLVLDTPFSRATHDVIVLGEPRTDYRLFVEVGTEHPGALVHFPALGPRERDSIRIVRKSAR